ncbi:uncharacterized protein LOC120539573 isoform X2 [Polypterus senegalus]|uniref:uncharacterized protein LOC120539573 isoform X2 n=1 Tax=Polypterus senegalus TaxID=55291 RepID=UPI0019654FD4|nr:uncharacterized protein LOC120539573 isoform X2 [Polypterus senegalus]
MDIKDEAVVPGAHDVYIETDSRNDENPLQNETVSQRDSPEVINLSSPGVLTQLLNGSENLSEYRNWRAPQTPTPSEVSYPLSSRSRASRRRISPGPYDSLRRRLSSLGSRSPMTTYSDLASRYTLRPEHEERHRERLQELAEILGLLVDHFVKLEGPIYSAVPEMCRYLMNMNDFYRALTRK